MARDSSGAIENQKSIGRVRRRTVVLLRESSQRSNRFPRWLDNAAGVHRWLRPPGCEVRISLAPRARVRRRIQLKVHQDPTIARIPAPANVDRWGISLRIQIVQIE
jgi:hypothetical protein